MGVLPHWSRTQLRAMAEELEDLLARVARESPALAPLHDDEDEDEPGEDAAP